MGPPGGAARQRVDHAAMALAHPPQPQWALPPNASQAQSQPIQGPHQEREGLRCPGLNRGIEDVLHSLLQVVLLDVCGRLHMGDASDRCRPHSRQRRPKLLMLLLLPSPCWLLLGGGCADGAGNTVRGDREWTIATAWAALQGARPGDALTPSPGVGGALLDQPPPIINNCLQCTCGSIRPWPRGGTVAQGPPPPAQFCKQWAPSAAPQP